MHSYEGEENKMDHILLFQYLQESRDIVYRLRDMMIKN